MEHEAFLLFKDKKSLDNTVKYIQEKCPSQIASIKSFFQDWESDLRKSKINILLPNKSNTSIFEYHILFATHLMTILYETFSEDKRYYETNTPLMTSQLCSNDEIDDYYKRLGMAVSVLMEDDTGRIPRNISGMQIPVQMSKRSLDITIHDIMNYTTYIKWSRNTSSCH